MQQKSEVPEGWTETALENILSSLESGSRPKGGVRGILEGIPSIGGEHLNENGGFRFDKIKFVAEEFFEKMNQGIIEINDILIVKDGATTGKVSIVKEDFPYDKAAVNEHVFLCRPYPELSSYYIFYFLFSEMGQKRILNNFRGSAQGGINKSFAPNTIIPLPPLAEQHRIVSAIEAFFARLDATNEKLGRVQEILKKFRESVLTSAFNGRLTEDWRVVFQNSKTESESFEKHINVNSIYFSGNPMTTNNEVFPALPNKWYWVTIEQLVSNEPRSIQSGPFGSNLLHSEFQKTGILAIGIDNVLYRSFSSGKEHRVSNEKYQELKKYTARPLDVLITVMATVGRCCVVPQDIETAIITKHVYRITPNREVISPYYLMNALSGAAIVKEQIDNQIRGQTRPGINGKILKEISIPLPPLPEQQEIVRRVDALFAFADSIEAKVTATREKTEKLRQSILAKAFSGELVETEAEISRREGRDYETAEVLIERIKKERGKGEKK